MDFIGFIGLGEHTPHKMENKLGDHALVIMFQPFAGHGLQALACFLSGGNISGDVLSKIMLECVILCENAGLYIDVITSDGASWNRKMWEHLGVEDPNEPWCEHPMVESRKLRMCSDFPHLIKCLRNNFISKKKFRIPEGWAEFVHFENLLKYESDEMFKMAFKLTESHIYPSYGQKMNTRLAFQLFSNTTAQALKIYQSSRIFTIVDPTITFCERINRLIDIMNSSKPQNGLRQNSREYEELDSFLIYLDIWKQSSPSELFISKSTYEGFRATLSCTLDLCTYLSNLGFKYLITSRLNQDHLEHFFGMMRAAGGCNSHPESIQVGQIFRLMSLYSLIKPPRGSNVIGGDMMKSLIKIGELKGKRQKLEFDLEIEGNFYGFVEEFPEIEEAFAYFCGYVAKKVRNTTDCRECIRTIVSDGNEKYNQFIRNISRGYLTFPSQNIINFLHEIERKISDIFEKEINRNCLLEVFYRLSYLTPKSVIGCVEHRNNISKYALQTYLISRMSISCKKEQNERAKKNKSKHYAKLAKLY